MNKKTRGRSPSEIKEKINVKRCTVRVDCMDGQAASPTMKSKLSPLINAQGTMHIEVSQTSPRIPAAIQNHAEIPNHGDSRPFTGGIIRRWDAQSKEWILPQDWREEE